MPLINPPIIIKSDIRKEKNVRKPIVTQNDEVILKIEVYANDDAFDLTGAASIMLASERKDGQVVFTVGSAVGNMATFALGKNEVAIEGEVKAKAQFHDAEGRISTLNFAYIVEKDLINDGYVPTEGEETLLSSFINSAQIKIDELSNVDVVELSLELDATNLELTKKVATINGVPPDSNGNSLIDIDTSDLATKIEMNLKASKAYVDSRFDAYSPGGGSGASLVSVSVGQYATGDGTLETVDVQNALDAGAGKGILFPAGMNFNIAGMTIHPDTIIYGYGSKVFNNTAHVKMFNIGSGVKIYGLEMEGYGWQTPNSQGVAINIVGTLANKAKNIYLEDCYIHDFGYWGVAAEFAEYVDIVHCKIERVGYAGVRGNSVHEMHVYGKSIIRDVKGLLSGNNNGYGVVFSRTVGSLAMYPRSTDCSCTFSLIENVLTWEGLDTHGGDGIIFRFNVIRNCRVGVVLTDSTDQNGNDVIGTHNSYANYNRVYGFGRGYGINATGNATELMRGCNIDNNYLFRCGTEGSETGGAIRMGQTLGLSANGNILDQCYGNGFFVYIDNHGFSISDATIIDMQDATLEATGILIDLNRNKGIIENIKFLKKSTTINTKVAKRAIHHNTWAGTNLNDISLGATYNEYDTFVTGMKGAHIHPPVTTW